MVKKSAKIDAKGLLLGATAGAGLVAFAIQYFRKHPEHWLANIRRQIVLDKVLDRARKNTTIFLKKPYRYVLFSDQHKGSRERADDFKPCEITYLAALDEYNKEGYTLVEMGDVEELWENSIPPVMQANSQVFESIARFYPHRYLRIGGNHDNTWENETSVQQYLTRYFPGIRIWPQILFHFEDDLGNWGDILCIHGHQGTWDADIFDFFPPLILPYFRRLQNRTGIGRTSPSTDTHSRSIQDNQMYTWANRQSKLILIAGHTHRPIWSSMTHQERLVTQLHTLKSMENPPENYAAEVRRLQTEINYRNQVDPLDKGEIIKQTPCYFNTGCCSFADGDITGIEIDDGQMRLVKWKTTDGNVKRTVLENDSLVKIFEST
jgi:UDP-2,3-diacylglucosamine pyrophosphatase LpxH